MPWWFGGRGRGWFWSWFWLAPMIQYFASKGYYYIGPCRSGFGPWAFFITPTGQIIHAWQLLSTLFPTTTSVPFPYYGITSPENELSFLENQKRILEEQLKALKEQLKRLKGEE